MHRGLTHYADCTWRIPRTRHPSNRSESRRPWPAFDRQVDFDRYHLSSSPGSFRVDKPSHCSPCCPTCLLSDHPPTNPVQSGCLSLLPVFARRVCSQPWWILVAHQSCWSPSCYAWLLCHSWCPAAIRTSAWHQNGGRSTAWWWYHEYHDELVDWAWWYAWWHHATHASVGNHQSRQCHDQASHPEGLPGLSPPLWCRGDWLLRVSLRTTHWTTWAVLSPQAWVKRLCITSWWPPPQLLHAHNESHATPHSEIVQPGHLPAQPIAPRAKLPRPTGQTKLHHFFTKRSQVAKPRSKKKSAPGQTTLHAFFLSAPNSPCPKPMHDDASHELHDDPQQADGTAVNLGNIRKDAIDHKCSASQEGQPPVFTTTHPVQPALPQPGPQPRPAWRIHLANIFEELATVVHRETGPVMQVEVWYIHHRNFPECMAPRALELDNIQELWYADLCNLWFDRIQRHEPMRVVNVLPTPPHQARPRSAAHIILEQGLSPDRIAVHFTAIFLGGTHLGLFQRVESSPTRICTRDMIVKHGFQLQCDFRPCNMHSGLLRFAMDDREEVFSGICVVLTVAPPPQEPLIMPPQLEEGHPALQDHEPIHDANALMQQPIPPKRPPAGIRPADHTIISVHSPAPLFDHRMTPAALTDFRATLMWQLGIQAGRCRITQADQIQVHTWYLNSDTCIRTEASRVVQLRPQPHTWHQDIVERWVDRLDPLYPVQMHVVTPNPPGMSLVPEAHVIVLQRPNPLWRSALLTVLQPRSDPWHLQFVCAMLDAETSLEQLGFISGVTHPSNPAAHLSGIVAKQGQAQLQRDGTFPVRHGYWFDIQAYSLEDHLDDEVATIQLHFTTLRKLIGGIQNHMSLTTRTCMSPGIDPPDQDMPAALTVTVSPNDPGTYLNPFEVLPFFTALQSHWQPLALLQPPELPALVPVITWYIDHIRFPQCFQPRLVLLNHNPEDWIQRLRSVWVDLILPQQVMHVHIVQPPPPEMPMHVAAHLLIVQQPIEQFRAVLITTYDSALPDEPPINHASITPTPVAFSTVIALAYRDTVCQHPNVDCAVWVGEEELPQTEERHVVNGHSLVVAVHRHNQPMPAGGTEWDLAQMHCNSGSRCSLPPPPAYAKKQTPSAIQEKGNRVILHLEAVLPPAPTNCTWDDSQPQLLWFTNEAWLFKLSRAPPCKLHPLPEGLRLPDVCYWPLIHPTPSDNPAHQLTLYLDGAANGTHAAWSVIATINLPIGEVFIGCMHGCVHLEPAHPQWIGADAMDNIAAELSALAMAQTCALRWPYSDHQICIRPDLSLSRTVANAITTCRSNAKLAQLCRIQGLWLASKTQILEIRGHQGHAWNELADTVAKWALVQGSHDAEPSLCALHEFATQDHDVAWAWMQTTHPALSACFPCLIDQQVMQFTPSTMRVQGTPTEPDHGGSPDHSHASWTMTVITANVLAAEVWNAQPQGSRRTGQRTLRLDHQWHKHGAHIIGVQEARTAAGQYHSPHYRIFASGATVARAPLYGCELWIHKTQPIAHDAQGNPIILGDAKVSIRHADPRRLVAVASIGQVHYTFVVLHAPCQATQSTDNQSNGDVVAEWWTTTSAIWHSTVTTELCWVLTDANAPIDGEHGHHTGPLGAENPSKAGTAFLQFLVENDLAVPCTFPHIHQGQTATWSHATGKQSRKDYVAIKAKMMPLATQSCVDIHHDNTFAHDDHLPVVLSCKGWQQLQPSVAAFRWDAEKLLDPTCCQNFQQALNTLPIPHWSVDVDDHAAIQEAQLLQLGQKFFAKAPSRSHKITLQPDTLAIIALKRQALDYGRAQQELHHPSFKEELRHLENWSTARYVETRRPSTMPSWTGLTVQVSSTIIVSCTKCWLVWAARREARHQGQGHFPCWRRKTVALQQHMMNSNICGWHSLPQLKPVCPVAGLNCSRNIERTQRIAVSMSKRSILLPSRLYGKYKAFSPGWKETKSQGPTTCPRHCSRRGEKSWHAISLFCSLKQLPLPVNPCYGRAVHWSRSGKARNHQTCLQRTVASSCPIIRPNCTTNLSGNTWWRSGSRGLTIYSAVAGRE